MKLSALENKVLTELVEQFRARFGATEVFLYGSAARNQMDEASDVDLFVVLPKVDWRVEKEIISLCFDAELECGRVFSAMCCSVNDLYNSPLSESPLVVNVRKQGLAL
jgi:predicted nucleotidyltransferase